MTLSRATRAAMRCTVLGALLSAAGSPVRPAPALEWPGYGGDAGNTRYSPAAQITPANVSSLRLAWTFHTGVAGTASFESTPVVAGGRLFVTAPDDQVFALDPRTGRRLWHAVPYRGSPS